MLYLHGGLHLRHLQTGVTRKQLAAGQNLPQDETVVDTVVDLGVYCFLWAADMANVRPEQFERFVKAAAALNNG